MRDAVLYRFGRIRSGPKRVLFVAMNALALRQYADFRKVFADDQRLTFTVSDMPLAHVCQFEGYF